MAPSDRDLEVDLESGVKNSVEDSCKDAGSGVKTQTKSMLAKVSGAFADGAADDEERVNLCGYVSDSGGGSVDRANLEDEIFVDQAEKKMRQRKPSSNSNLFAMVFTVLFCLVILFQGMSSRATSASSVGSPVSSETAEDGLISVQYFRNPSASESNGPGSGYPYFIETIAGSDPPKKTRRTAIYLHFLYQNPSKIKVCRISF
ncbi:hypothetical protein OIU85_006169 [Salix viminalis]|uniref:Uncharacterized protein n=1 Tax=Salix viminalis TaxID=40686 RepID=A0A9Q0SU72_SALVM|nr:hypothetical protein OIU85_006169 [Salix viminalis]